MFTNRKRGNTIFRSVNDTYSSSSVFTPSSTSTSTSTSTSNTTKTIISYVELQNDVGSEITLILEAFTTGSSDLEVLLEYDSYNALADKLASYEKTGSDNLSKTFEEYRKLLIFSIEAAKRADTRQKEQTAAFNDLQARYDAYLNPTPSNSVLETSAYLNTIALAKPEIVEYIKRGYNIIDADGYLIPIDMAVIANIRTQLNLS